MLNILAVANPPLTPPRRPGGQPLNRTTRLHTGMSQSDSRVSITSGEANP